MTYCTLWGKTCFSKENSERECRTVNIKTCKRKTTHWDERFGEGKARRGGRTCCIWVVFCLLCVQCARNVHMCSCKPQFRHREARRHAICLLHLKLTFQLNHPTCFKATQKHHISAHISSLESIHTMSFGICVKPRAECHYNARQAHCRSIRLIWLHEGVEKELACEGKKV